MNLRWRRARDVFESQIPVTTGGFEKRFSSTRSNYLIHYKTFLLTGECAIKNYSNYIVLKYRKIASFFL